MCKLFIFYGLSIIKPLSMLIVTLDVLHENFCNFAFTILSVPNFKFLYLYKVLILFQLIKIKDEKCLTYCKRL